MLSPYMLRPEAFAARLRPFASHKGLPLIHLNRRNAKVLAQIVDGLADGRRMILITGPQCLAVEAAQPTHGGRKNLLARGRRSSIRCQSNRHTDSGIGALCQRASLHRTITTKGYRTAAKSENPQILA